jgi:hypothetical protein
MRPASVFMSRIAVNLIAMINVSSQRRNLGHNVVHCLEA